MFLGSLKYKMGESSQRTSHLYVFPPNIVDLVDLKIINASCGNNERSYGSLRIIVSTNILLDP